ncbi:hypothetical protein RIF25_08165 [Thermosynechococcaceae cyanobacterium BACA0444]|uniref:Uncharacterized protein n=1 Tax=Pseudocalidococcus azoricus BACA0444 TaxID=2918990 RepID=A0AAE4JX49_9CYAN|nr:hypothetical protein [Pseudocalidococcus azoricus]MDS3860788.1 hypothetical protein [Pseudocalidococcus azoricus BACA0444]
MGYIEPPYFLLVASLVAAIACGRAFEITLKERVGEWSRTRSTRILSQLQGEQLFVPYLGICGGVCSFLASGLSIYGFPLWLSGIVSFILTLGTGALIWSQLGKLLSLLAQGGSQAIDLDTLDIRE